MPELRVVVAGQNSTMAESHRDDDHYGWVGEHQLKWFADRLAGYRAKGWLRLAAVHHNVVRGAVLDEENLRDADDLYPLPGEPGLANLLLPARAYPQRAAELAAVRAAGAVHRERGRRCGGAADRGAQPGTS